MNIHLNKFVVVSTLPSPLGANGGPVDFNALGDKFILTPARPVDIIRWGYITDTAQDPDAGGFKIALDHRPTAGSDTGRVEKATITRADAEVSAAGAVIYNDVILAVAEATSADGSKYNVGPAGPLRVEPGQQAVIEVTDANGAASTGYVFIEYEEQPFKLSGATRETS